MDRIAHFLVRRSRGVLAATALLTLAAVAMLPRLSFDADVTSFLTRSSDEGRAFAALQERYGTGDPIMVLLTRTDGEAMDDREGMALLAEARTALGALGPVASVGAFVPSELPIGNVPLTPQAIRSLPAPLLAALRNGPGTELLLSEAGDATLLVVQVDGDALAAARAVRDAPLPMGLEATYAGNPMVFAEVLGLLGWFLLAIPPTVIVLLLAVFTAALGGPRLAALAMLPALLGSVWTFGLLFALGIRVDLITVIVPVFVIVMGSADGLHFVSHLRAAAARGLAREAQVASALREVGVPMVLITVVASSIVLGVGIDYAIHLIAAIEHARRADPERTGWVVRGLRAATRPIVANALGVAIGLTALQASPLRPHHQISALMWVAMLVAAITTLVLIPAASPRSGTVER